MKGYHEKLIKADRDDALSKPVHREELLSAIARWLPEFHLDYSHR
jgi:hypothetical protein